MDYRIINVQDYAQGLDIASAYIHAKWGDEDNYNFYFDAIVNSSKTNVALPRFYLMLKGEEIVGCFAILTNDLISRQDLWPWVACIFVEVNERGSRLCEKMLHKAKSDAARAGYETLYLTTDHESLYEKFGWQRIEDGFDVFGESGRIYQCSTQHSVCSTQN